MSTAKLGGWPALSTTKTVGALPFSRFVRKGGAFGSSYVLGHYDSQVFMESRLWFDRINSPTLFAESANKDGAPAAVGLTHSSPFPHLPLTPVSFWTVPLVPAAVPPKRRIIEVKPA